MHDGNKKRQWGRYIFLVVGLLSLIPAWAFQPFVIKNIRVEGLQRISVGTVFNYLPLKKGDHVDEKASTDAIRALYKTGFFKDVVLEREDDTLVVFVVERPAIASIKIEGNEAIPSDKLMESLKQIGFAEGRIFDRAMLDNVEQELERQYLSLGKYGVRIESEVTPEPRNRVAIRIDIAEGKVAKIKSIDIVGNTVFSDQELLRQFQLGTTPIFSLFSTRDQYSKQKLSGDLEKLRSYYLDRGYINFNIESTQVSITPDRSQVYITINVHEGDKYTVGDVHISGKTILPEKDLRKLISIKKGDVFSRRAVTDSTKHISERLGDVGYAFANVNAIPDLDKEKKQVSLTFFVDPGKRVYIRRINITGNAKTQDEVVRRELRQMEDGWLSTQRIKRSRTRLNRLGYFDDVTVETPAVPGTPDQVDTNIKLKERDAFGSLSFGVGYGDASGFMVNASVSEQNFLGTGKHFSLVFNNSTVNKIYSFNFTDPYYTLNGVSRSYNFSYRTTDYNNANIVNFATDTAGAGVGFGIPTSEYDTVRWGLNYDATRIKTFTDTSSSITDFCVANATLDDCSFDAYKASASWAHDTRNRTIFATRGSLQLLSTEVAVPAGGKSVSFYKARYQYRGYWPLTDKLTFSANGELSYGDSYGDTSELPPFERYYAGGTRTVRGYKANTLGPRDQNGDPIGGNARIVAGTELIFPSPFAENGKSVKLSAFLDAGNVYDTRSSGNGIDLAQLRYSAGLSLVWLSPMGALNFNIADPLNPKPGDDTETFQFTLGSPF